MPIYNPENPFFWTLFNKVTGTKIKRRQATPATALPDPGEPYALPPRLDPSLAWLVESKAAEPVFNADTERLEPGEAITIDPANTSTGTLVFQFVAVPLSPAQLDNILVQKQLRTLAPEVNAIASAVRDTEDLTSTQVCELVRYIALRDRLDLPE